VKGAAARWAAGAVGALGIYLVVILLVIVGAATSSKFIAPAELLGTVQEVALLGIVAAGVMFVTYSGHYADLSVPTTMALAGVVSVSTLGLGLMPAIACGLLAGLGIGVVNGIAVGYLRANPIIWTLATFSAGGGLLQWALHSRQTYPKIDDASGHAFVAMFGAQIVGIPLVVLILAVLVVCGQFLLAKTKFGAQLKLAGSSYEVARMTGVNVRLRTMQAFMLSALGSAVGGVLLASLSRLAAADVGKGYDFKAVTAVVLGGVSLAGGRGNMVGVLGGVLAIGMLEKVLSLNGVGVDRLEVVKGVLFIAVVGVGAYMARRQGGDDA